MLSLARWRIVKRQLKKEMPDREGELMTNMRMLGSYCNKGTIPTSLSVQNLDPQRAAEPPGAIVRFCTVVIHEDMVVATIAKDGAAKFSNFRRCFHPARRFRIEISQVSATPDIVLPLKAQCPWQLPYP